MSTRAWFSFAMLVVLVVLVLMARVMIIGDVFSETCFSPSQKKISHFFQRGDGILYMASSGAPVVADSSHTKKKNPSLSLAVTGLAIAIV